jgi:hypothetical protein
MGDQYYDSYGPVLLRIGRVMLSSVIAEEGPGFFITSTITGAVRENMSPSLVNLIQIFG